MIKRISVLLLLLALSMTALFGCSQTKETKHASAIINTDKTNKEENLTPVTLNEEAHSIYTVIQTEEARYKALGNELNDDTYNNTEYKKELTETITKKTGIQNVTFGTCSHIGKDNAEYYVNFKSDDGKNVYSVIKRNKDITVSVN